MSHMYRLTIHSEITRVTYCSVVNNQNNRCFLITYFLVMSVVNLASRSST